VRPKPIAVPVYMCLLFAAALPACSLFGEPKAIQLDPITGILDALQSHQIVALGEGRHGNNQSHAFRLALVRDPRFANVVNDIVVEFGSARHQAVIDRFVRGGDVPDRELRRAWQDTTQGPLWDSPIYEEFFRAVREVNATLPNDRQMRVLLGDPPIDWDAVKTPHDLGQWIGLREQHVVDVIKNEVLSKNRRALVVYGDGHFRRYTKLVGGSDHPTLVSMIEREGTKAFSVWTNTTVELERMQKDIASWPIPSLTIVRGTRLGTLNFKYFAGMETDPPTRMEEQFDAVLYLGPVPSITFSEPSPALCADAEYTRMRLERLALGPLGAAGPDVERFEKRCAAHLISRGHLS
jgi:hypothetical protein